MRLRILLLSGFLLILGTLGPGMMEALAQVPTITPDVILSNPRDGEALQGIVSIKGRVRGERLRSLDVMFSYASGSPSTWFYISDVPFEAGEASQAEFHVEWDTTKITDGNYVIRAQANYADGKVVTTKVSDLRIRNYSPIETNTPHPQGTLDSTRGAPEVRVETIRPSPTPFPPNPATLGQGEIWAALFKGLGVATGLYLAYGAYRWVWKSYR